MPPPKTYILPPTFDYTPNSSIRLGNLLSDPFTPHRPLAVLPNQPGRHHPIITTTQTNLSITHTTTRSASLSLSAQLLELAGLKAASELSLSGTTTYSAARVTTRVCEPSTPADEDAIHELVMATPRAKRILFGGAVGVGGRLFLITGVKTAEGFTVASESGVKKGGSLGGDVPLAAVVPGLAVGAEVGVGRERSEGEGYTVEEEVVIAYRVVVVRKRGWRGSELELAEFRGRDRERMLGDDEVGDGESGEDMIEVAEVGVEDIGIEGDDEEEVSIKKVVVESEEGEVVVLSMDDGME
ncbi:hypothetical protein B0I37DRAFT_435328 [Chaetomium sp. MPI-CAGE-AT-0009]|nr:hypothetical protein B0I37DRAFT_435328 [Chaetomium sp. MPI-CAGE-AT-0009]